MHTLMPDGELHISPHLPISPHTSPHLPTPPYCAPEVLRPSAAGYGAAVDIYSCGVALFAGGTVTRLPAPKLEKPVVDTTGAGDSFVGAFCHGLASGLAEIDAIKLGMACASDSVTREGTQTSFPTRERCVSLGILSG